MEKTLLQTWIDMNKRLFNFVNQKIKNEDLSKDIIQEVFVKALSNIDQLKNEEKLVNWIYQITRNEIINSFRKSKLVSSNIILPEIADDSHNQEFSNCILPMINALPDKYKQALTYADIQGVSQKQLALDLNISYSAAKSRVQRGREKLKNLLLECCTISYDVYGNIMEYEDSGCSKTC